MRTVTYGEFSAYLNKWLVHHSPNLHFKATRLTMRLNLSKSFEIKLIDVVSVLFDHLSTYQITGRRESRYTSDIKCAIGSLPMRSGTIFSELFPFDFHSVLLLNLECSVILNTDSREQTTSWKIV